jgi:hypothetical protein
MLHRPFKRSDADAVAVADALSGVSEDKAIAAPIEHLR